MKTSSLSFVLLPGGEIGDDEKTAALHLRDSTFEQHVLSSTESSGSEVLWSTNPSTAKDIWQLVCNEHKHSKFLGLMCELIGIFCAAQRLGPACTSVGRK